MAESGDKHSRLAVVVEFPVEGTLWANGGLVEAEGVDDWLIIAIFKDETSCQRHTIDEGDQLVGSIVDVNAVKTTRVEITNGY